MRGLAEKLWEPWQYMADWWSDPRECRLWTRAVRSLLTYPKEPWEFVIPHARGEWITYILADPNLILVSQNNVGVPWLLDEMSAKDRNKSEPSVAKAVAVDFWRSYTKGIRFSSLATKILSFYAWVMSQDWNYVCIYIYYIYTYR